MTGPAPACMLQGTGSDVGKSVLTAGLCRAFVRQGLRVLPFKPQNMSNNAAVTPDTGDGGGEIGRAQALQAQACKVAPSVDMNPVLLKPQSDTGAQVIVHGKVAGKAEALDFGKEKPKLMAAVLESFARLRAEADLVLVEGAGSPAEINLRAGDIANMGFATAAGVPVVLIGDVDRGGVIAALAGTFGLLPPDERALIRATIVNKFRGDIRLFEDAVGIIEQETHRPCLGVVPWFPRIGELPAEDAVALDRVGRGRRDADAVLVAVPMLSRISNFDDLDPLAAEPGVEVAFVPPGTALPGDADLVVLPGSKATVADLAFLRAQGWDIDILAHHRRGGRIIGVCAGYQMLGRRVADPDGIEGKPGEVEGLGLLDIETIIAGDKTLTEAFGMDTANGVPVQGYEMHVGETSGADTARPMLTLDGKPDGAVSPDGRVRGCYLHGLFAGDAWRGALLENLRGSGSAIAYDAQVDDALDALADHLTSHVDLDALLAVARAGVSPIIQDERSA